MSKGMIYKFIFILFLTVISVLLILPTVGSKQMEVSFSVKAEVSDIENVISRFSD